MLFTVGHKSILSYTEHYANVVPLKTDDERLLCKESVSEWQRAENCWHLNILKQGLLCVWFPGWDGGRNDTEDPSSEDP